MPYQAEGISAPWLGWKDDLPSMISPSNSFKQITNAVINKGRLYSFPLLGGFTGPPDGNPILLARTFVDILGNVHTVFVTTTGVYYLNADGTYNKISAAQWLITSTFPLASAEMLNKLWFTGPANLNINSINGEQTAPTNDIGAGGAYFMGVLGSRLVIANTIEPVNFANGSTPFPYRVRWSAVGDPTNWTDITSGAKDIVEVEDSITGYVTLAQVGYVFRTNGITTQTPTGSSQLPFVFDSYSLSEVGIGNAILGSLAAFGEMCIFVGNDDVYQLTAASFPQRIGGAAKRSIFKDLANATGPSTAAFIAWLVPGTDYLSYWLCIPQTNNVCSVWIYHMDDQTWVNEQLPFGTLQFLRAITIA